MQDFFFCLIFRTLQCEQWLRRVRHQRGLLRRITTKRWEYAQASEDGAAMCAHRRTVKRSRRAENSDKHLMKRRLCEEGEDGLDENTQGDGSKRTEHYHELG